MKKIFYILIIFLMFFNSVIEVKSRYSYAESGSSEIEIELNENIEEQLNSLDMSQMDEILKELGGDSLLLHNQSFSDKIRGLISGEISIDANTFFNYFFTLLLDDVVDFLPYICLIIAIAIIYSIVSSTQEQNKNISDIIHFVCFGAILIIVVTWVAKLISLTSSTLFSLKSQMETIFPLLLTVLTALGSAVSVGIYQPAMAILSSGVITFFINILLPIFSTTIIFLIISNLTKEYKFNKFKDFFSSGFKWILGILLTVFTAFVSLQGFMAGSVDSISIRTAKYTIKSAVPLIGGFLSDGISLILVSSSLIKNAIGVGGLLILISTMLMPVIKILFFSFLLKLGSAILEPIADSRVSNFVSSVGKTIQMLIALILGVAFMYFILVALVMCSTNIL